MAILYSLAKLTCKLSAVYRMYKSLKVGHSRRIKKNVTYCVVITYLEWIEILADRFIGWFPFYNEFKFFIIIWLILAPLSAASILYKAHIDSFFRMREKDVNFVLHNLHQIRRLSRPTISFHKLQHIASGPMVLLHGSAIFWLIGISIIVILGHASFIIPDFIEEFDIEQLLV